MTNHGKQFLVLAIAIGLIVQQSEGQGPNLTDLQLTMNTSVLEEGLPVRFFCSSEGCTNLKIFYIDGEIQSSNQPNPHETVSLDLIPARNQSGSVLECRMLSGSGSNIGSANLTLNINYPPETVFMTTESGACMGTTCDMTMVLWGEYNFTCQSLSSSQAYGFRWAITSKDGDVIDIPDSTQESKSEHDGGWNGVSRVTLRAQANYNGKRLVCHVLYPDNKTYQKLTVTVAVDRSILILLSVAALLALAVFLICAFAVYGACKTITSKWSPDRDVTALSRLSIKSKQRLSKKCSVSLDILNQSKTFRDNFPRERIQMLNVLGEGSFGVVYMAIADGILEDGKKHTVAVKMLKASVSSNDVSGFMKELDVCKTLEKHPHIVELLGCCTDKEPFCLIFEFASKGNLQSFLRDKRKSWSASSPCDLTSDLILKFAHQIASGMEYLSSMQIIHRDLATRNILLTEDLTCKLSDFGFSRDVLFESLYEMSSNGDVPIRWMAIESIVENKYTTMSDVWSYGVLLWEIFTLGSHPYPGMDVNNVIRALQDGLRLPKPAHCSDKLYDLMKSCWSPDPSDRPDFFKLLEMTQKMATSAHSFLQMSEFVPDQYE
ncbi:fibroblast growth factor receptor 4-like [Asterias amurensis]|uniref:fibroblast growth factor receptor 4-like n=1 Tax=Asterias amurensis TaxID=7602 RepID=UPI003AB8AD33